jgi:DNA-directed RNA polymerase specialized sigma24 family protein
MAERPPPLFVSGSWDWLMSFWRAPQRPDVRDLLALQQLDGVMGAAVHRLSPEHQQLLAMRFGNGFTVAQVARATRQSKADVRMQQLLALRALQHELESHAS